MAYSPDTRRWYRQELDSIRDAGLLKQERFIHGAQGAEIDVEFPPGTPARRVINLCANNYLGLASDPEVVSAAIDGLDARGYGMSSVRFICGTQDIHRDLEIALTEFLGAEDTLLFPSCMDANAGVFEALLGEKDVLIADRLVHASIVDGMRLCKAMQDTYKHSDMAHLEEKLLEHRDKRFRMIVTDGVFSMDGDVAKLDEIVDLADRHDAMVCVDDSHATGFMGPRGRGTHERCGVVGRVDLITTTLGKALGGASGGCVSGRRELVELCRQRARPYLFSNAVAPPIVAGALRVLEILTRSTERRDRLERNAVYWRQLLVNAGFDVRPGESPIVPVMLYNAKLAQDMARDLFTEGIYVVGFFFPVVPKGQARIRTQVSAAHELHHLDLGIEAFHKVGRRYGVLGKGRKELVEAFGL
ncbi:MAG TPA: glycine C-acetyltransferase [Candidatus Polarisedimenticolaceae bacterium]